MNTDYGIKVRKMGDLKWNFLGGNGSVTPLRIHASRWIDDQKCIGVAQEIADGNRDEYDVKVVVLGKKSVNYKLITECKPVVRTPKPRNVILTGTNAYSIARDKAQTGHRHWIAWEGRDGEACAARLNAETLKIALLASGTKGRFVHYAKDRHGMIINWQLGITYLSNIKHGWFF